MEKSNNHSLNNQTIENQKKRRNISLFMATGSFRELRFFSPLAIIYFSQIAGSYTKGMLVFSVINFSTFLMEIPTGIFSDVIGRRKTTIVGTIIAFSGVFFYALADSLWGLIVGALFDGIARALHSGNDEALLYDTLVDINETDKFTKIFSKAITFFQICGAISAIVGGFIGEWSLKALVWISLLPLFLRIIFSFMLVEPTQHKNIKRKTWTHLKVSVSKILSNKKLSAFILGSSLLYAMEETCWYFRAIFVKFFWSITGVGFSRVLSKLSGASGSYITGKLIKRFGALNILIGGNLFGRIMGLIAVIFPSHISPIFLGITNSSYSSNLVSKQTLLQKEFSSNERATMGSIESFLGSVLFSIFYVLTGMVADYFSPALAIGVLQVAQLPVLLIFWYYSQSTSTSLNIKK